MNKLLVMAAALGLLTACKAPTPSSALPELSPSERFVMNVQRSMRSMALQANDELLVGSAVVSVEIDRQGAILNCEVGSPSDDKQGLLTYNSRFAQKLSGACWGLILPLPPEDIWQGQMSQKIIAPLMFPVPTEDSLRTIAHATLQRRRDNYLWHNLFAGLTVSSIGRAAFRIKPDEQGRTQTCEVSLYPHPYRRDAFHADEGLRNQLQARCELLNPQEMPYLKMKRPIPEYWVSVDYAPWKMRLNPL